jgi:hypothetical protein
LLPWDEQRVRAALGIRLATKTSWPTTSEFQRDGLATLSEALSRHGGATRWAAEFGLPRNRFSAGPSRYWTDARIRAELTAFTVGSRLFPSRRELSNAGLGGMMKAIDDTRGAAWWAAELNLATRTGPAITRHSPRPRKTQDAPAAQPGAPGSQQGGSLFPWG